MLDLLNSIVLFPYSIGKYIFSLAAYWFGINYALQSDAFIAFTEYCEQRWNDWVKKK